MRWVKRHILPAYAILAFCYLLLPIAVVILFSFNAPSGRFNYVWEGFTFDNWVNWDAPPGIQSAVGKSLEIALVSTVAATVPLAGLASWVQIKRELTALPEVRWVAVGSFTQTRARVTIGHLGDLERLKAAVGRVGLELIEETDGWQLRPAGALGEPSVFTPDTAVAP